MVLGFRIGRKSARPQPAPWFRLEDGWNTDWPALDSCPGSGDRQHDMFLKASLSSSQRLKAVAVVPAQNVRNGRFTHTALCVIPLFATLLRSDPDLDLHDAAHVLARAGSWTAWAKIPGEGYYDTSWFWHTAVVRLTDLVSTYRPGEADQFRDEMRLRYR
jgi:hypothetical protein